MVDSYTLWNGDSEVFWERTSRSQNRGEWIRPTTPPPPVQINKGQVPMLCLESHPSIWPKVWTNEISCLLWLWPGLLPWEAGLIWIQSAEENREGIVSLYKITAVLCFHRIWNSENIKKKKKFTKEHFWLNYTFQQQWKGTGLQLLQLCRTFRVLTTGFFWHVADIYVVATGMSVQSKVWGSSHKVGTRALIS